MKMFVVLGMVLLLMSGAYADRISFDNENPDIKECVMLSVLSQYEKAGDPSLVTLKDSVEYWYKLCKHVEKTFGPQEK